MTIRLTSLRKIWNHSILQLLKGLESSVMNLAELKTKVARVNKRHKKAFDKVPVSERILFISHCIIKQQREQIERLAGKLGYKFYKVGGGSIVLKKIEQEKPDAVVGIACFRELEMAVKEIKMPLQAILLETDGCKDTTVDLAAVEKILS